MRQTGNGDDVPGFSGQQNNDADAHISTSKALAGVLKRGWTLPNMAGAAHPSKFKVARPAARIMP